MCRAPVAAGQGVNILVRSIIADRFPHALALRLREAEEDLCAGEQAADEARRREALGTGAGNVTAAGDVTLGTGGHLGAAGAAPVLPLLEGFAGSVLLPHCPAEVEMRSSVEERLLDYALQGGRRLGILDGTAESYDEAARPMGVCFEIESVERGHQRKPRARLAAKFRFWLAEPSQLHEHGFHLGRCEAFFDEALTMSDLLIDGTREAAPSDIGQETAPSVARRTTAEIARDVLALLEVQLVHVGHSGRRVFGERFGDIPAPPRAGQPATSASLERLSFWFLGALLTDERERRCWLGSVDTRARLDHCADRIEAAGRRPVLNLPGASSWMSPGQSAFKSFALLVAIVALFVAKAMGLLEPGALRFGGQRAQHHFHGRDDPHDNNMQDAFVVGQLLR